MFIIYKMYKRIKNLSNKINNMYKVSPQIFIRFEDTDTQVNGSCITSYKKSDIILEINLPSNFGYKKKEALFIDMVLIHEYCHYIEALSVPAKTRKELIFKYIESSKERMRDEKKTWRQTKKMAKCLGLWNKLFYNNTQQCLYACDLTY